MATDDVTIRELARQVSEIFERFTDLAKRLESGQFVRTDIYNLQQEAVRLALNALETRAKALEDTRVAKGELEGLRSEVNELKDDKKWLVRLVLAFVVLGILGAVFVTRGAS